MSRIDRGPTEEAVLNPYFTDERLLKNAVTRAEAERDSWKILAALYKEACHESEAMLRLACSTYVYDAGTKGFVLVNDPDVQIRELRDRVRAEKMVTT